MQILVVTTSTRSARWKVLEQSIRSVHPDAAVSALWCDARIAARPGPDVVTAHPLDLGGLRFADLALALGERRAGWAALPWVIEDLRSRTARSLDSTGSDGADPWIVLDDSFVVLDTLDDLVDAGRSVPVVRSTHVDSGGNPWGPPMPGLVVLPEAASDHLEWWKARSIESVGSADEIIDSWWQSRAGVIVSADPAYRLSPASAGELTLTLDADGEVRVAGRRPALVDFDGFDPEAPWWFAAPDDEPTLLVSESDGLRQLCHAHAARLVAAGWSPGTEDEPGEVMAGIALTPALRGWYRSQLLGREPGSLPANPYVAGEVAGFVDALRGPGTHDGTGVSVHADLTYASRPDLRAALPQPRWRDRASFRRWIWTSGLSEGNTSLATLPEPTRPVPAVKVTGERRPFGVNLVGYMAADLGLGVAARQMQHALDAAGVPTATISYDRTSSNLRARANGGVDRPYHFNLILIVPDQLPLFVGDVGPGFLHGHHNIGLWYWESDTLTPHQESAFDHVDEVWAATTYLQDAFAAPARVPVALVPSPLVFQEPPAAPDQRARLGLDDRFTYLFSFDFLSVVARKNPLGLVEAYRRAFGVDDDTRLILKSINGDVFPSERERLLDAVADRSDIEVRDQLLTGTDRLALLAEADCYVSLHRSEGLGLTMAEAMAVGTPVIATAYSGNLDFMDANSALLVPAAEVLVGPGNYYPPEGHWADPDLDRAAQYLRDIRDDAAMRSRLSAAGRRAIEPFGYAEVGAIARDRLVESWSAQPR